MCAHHGYSSLLADTEFCILYPFFAHTALLEVLSPAKIALNPVRFHRIFVIEFIGRFLFSVVSFCHLFRLQCSHCALKS